MVETAKPHRVLYVCPVSYVYGCAEKQAQEARGVFGCHTFTTCPNCTVEPHGFELYADGGCGGMQGSAREHVDREAWLANYAAVQARHGAPVRFERGLQIYYMGAR